MIAMNLVTYYSEELGGANGPENETRVSFDAILWTQGHTQPSVCGDIVAGLCVLILFAIHTARPFNLLFTWVDRNLGHSIPSCLRRSAPPVMLGRFPLLPVSSSSIGCAIHPIVIV